MKAKILFLRKKYIVLLLLVLCLLMLLPFVEASSVKAQEEISNYFEITGGRSESIPIELEVGQMVQGELIIERTGKIRISLSDFSGTSIWLFGETSTRGGFYYAAETSSKYYLVVTNTNEFYVGTIGCTVKYSIVPANVSPGTGYPGEKVTKDVTKSSFSMTTVWIITGIVVFLGLLFLLIRSVGRHGGGDNEWEEEYRIYKRRR